MKSVKLYLFTLLLAIGVTCSANNFSTLFSGREIVASSGDRSDSSAEPVCTINQPRLNYCISVYDEKPVFRVFSQVISSLSTPLKFSLSYGDEIPSSGDSMGEASPVLMNATCSHHNCTAEFLIDSVNKLYTNLAINVTVSTDGCSNSTIEVTSGSTRLNEVVNITVAEVMATTAIIVCELPCFSEDFGCLLTSVERIENKMMINVDPTFHTSTITGEPYSYSYPTQNVTITNLNSNSKYHFCLSAVNLTTIKIHNSSQLCGNFTTENFTAKHHHQHSEGSNAILIAVIVTAISLLVVLLIFAAIIYRCCYKSNRALHGMTTAALMARAVASHTGFFVQMAQSPSDEAEIESIDEHEIDHLAPNDNISLHEDEHTDSV